MSDLKAKLKCFIDFCYMDNGINFKNGKDYSLSDRLKISNPKMLAMWDIWSDGYDQLTEENAELREALRSAINIKNLWLPETNMIVHTDEFCALHKMHDSFKKLL